MDEFTPEQEQYITEVMSRLGHRQAEVIDRIATELHALVMVLVSKRLVRMEDIDAARKRLDLAFEIGRARQWSSAVADLERLDRELDQGEGDPRPG